MVILIGPWAFPTIAQLNKPSFREAVSKVDLRNLNETLKTPKGAVLAFLQQSNRIGQHFDASFPPISRSIEISLQLKVSPPGRSG
jgi:hypothetical protein